MNLNKFLWFNQIEFYLQVIRGSNLAAISNKHWHKIEIDAVTKSSSKNAHIAKQINL
jgi:hypothetical protein